MSTAWAFSVPDLFSGYFNRPLDVLAGTLPLVLQDTTDQDKSINVSMLHDPLLSPGNVDDTSQTSTQDYPQEQPELRDQSGAVASRTFLFLS